MLAALYLFVVAGLWFPLISFPLLLLLLLPPLLLLLDSWLGVQYVPRLQFKRYVEAEEDIEIDRILKRWEAEQERG